MTIDRDKVLAALRDKRDHIERQYGLRMVGIIGSAARGEATAASDIDVWVDIVGRPTLFTISRAERDVAEALGLGLQVDFVFREDMKPAMRAVMQRDLIPIDEPA